VTEARATGLQMALLVRGLEGCRETASPREYLEVLDLLGRWIAAEQKRVDPVRRRWAA